MTTDWDIDATGHGNPLGRGASEPTFARVSSARLPEESAANGPSIDRHPMVPISVPADQGIGLIERVLDATILDCYYERLAIALGSADGTDALHRCEQLVSSRTSPTAPGDCYLLSFQNKIVASLVATALRNAGQQAIIDSKIEATLSLISHHDERYASLQCLAEEIEMSGERLRKLFVQSSSCTLRSYFRFSRLKHASMLLRHSPMSTSQIARAIGYGDASSFVNSFGKSFLTSPSSYRAQWTKMKISRSQAITSASDQPAA